MLPGNAKTRAQRKRSATAERARAVAIEEEIARSRAIRLNWARVREAFRAADAPEEYARLCEEMAASSISPAAFDAPERIARVCVTEGIARAQFSLRARGRDDSALRQLRLDLDFELDWPYRGQPASGAGVFGSPTRCGSSDRRA